MFDPELWRKKRNETREKRVIIFGFLCGGVCGVMNSTFLLFGGALR